MNSEKSNTLFNIRIDRNGLRPVYNLGNELGNCPFQCAFCGVGNSPQVTEEENIKNFDILYGEFSNRLQGRYHPVIYNQGNCTNPREFSWKTLRHILNRFRDDPDVAYVSINSRECYVSTQLLENLVSLELTYPVHFILGIESFSPRTLELLGKDTGNELQRLNEKLKPFNLQPVSEQGTKAYTFGLDVNLVFLPELYLGQGECRDGNESAIKSGWINEIQYLLNAIDPLVPVEINLHPYYRVKELPYESADLDIFMNALPEINRIVEAADFNHSPHIFLGVEGSGYDSHAYQQTLARWTPVIDEFNRTGCINPAVGNYFEA